MPPAPLDITMEGHNPAVWTVFSNGLSLVSDVVRIMNSSENDEGALDCCTARLESLLTDCVNLLHLLEEGLYNQLIDSIQYYLKLTPL